ncbi:protein YgfX [Nitrosomonas ureae]|nr:protein YgfX [Nitrosomonas ureae]
MEIVITRQLLRVTYLFMAVLSIHRKPSFWLAVILSSAHIATAMLLWPLSLPLEVKMLIAILLVISLVYYLGRDALLYANKAVISFTLSEKMQCTAITQSSKTITCKVLGSTFVSPYLVVLNLKPEGEFFPCSIVILSDGVDIDMHRQLRVWLRWKWRYYK